MGKVSSSNSQGVHVPKLRFPEFNETWELSRLSDISYYQTGKDIVPKSKYVSTENMLQNFAGMEPYKDEAIVSGIPFASGDVLIANIRPYLKKIWKANFAGCCNTDVLVLHSANINPDYLYYNIAREDFITHVMSGVKGSKMPRGDKTQILEYKVGVPTHKEQQKIASILSLLDNRIVKQRQLIEALKSYKRG
ncbi:restriction endonuclease subunit S, partial [Neglecta sp. X4]